MYHHIISQILSSHSSSRTCRDEDHYDVIHYLYAIIDFMERRHIL